VGVEVPESSIGGPHWLERYHCEGNGRLARLIRYIIHDVNVAIAHRLQSLSGFDGRSLPGFLARRWRSLLSAHRLRAARAVQDGHLYRAPIDLAVSPRSPRRAILIGSCFAQDWKGFCEDAPDGCPIDFFIFNNAGELPEQPPRALGEYDFQIVQIPLRSVIPDTAFSGLSYRDEAQFARVLEDSKARLKQFVEAAMRWNRTAGLRTYVANFLVPQQNPMGRLLPRYDIRNPVFFVEQLNAVLSAEIAQYRDTHLLDVDAIAATFGRKHCQDDALWPFNHAGVPRDNFDSHDKRRIEPPQPLGEHYSIRRPQFVRSIWAEIIAMDRTLSQVDQVKLVAIDLDDTLWRGVLADEPDISPGNTEGWPGGLIEALGILKKRGVLLAIVSRNDEERITALWDQVMLGRLHLDDFAARRINWRLKAENLKEIIEELGLLPRSVVFIDDNPIERESVATMLPEVRVLGALPYYLRRVLLWSPETQVATVTRESSDRTAMVQAQAVRESVRGRMSREAFLASLNISVRLFAVNSVTDPRFSRVFELLNKTNQFNTTGRRWTLAECAEAMASRRVFHAFEVDDRFTAYGLVGVVITMATSIEQFVMSCRVLGLDVEMAVLAELGIRLGRNAEEPLTGTLAATDANMACRDLFRRAGFRLEAGVWTGKSDGLAHPPAHVAIS
jgi:FkbH-like protein